MTQLTAGALIGASDIFTGSTTQLENLGARMETSDGRMFRYANASLLLVTGNLLQSPAVVTNHSGLTPSIFALGATSIVATLGATSAAANLYANGYAIVDTTPGNGYAYLVSGHASVASAAAITINLADSVQVAGTAASLIDLIINPYSGVIQNPTTLTGTVVGVCVFPIAAAGFGWVQTRGTAAALSSNTNAVGLPVFGNSSTAGSASGFGPLVGSQGVVIGWTQKVGIDGKNVPIYLTID